MWELARFYLMKFGIFCMYMNIRFRSMLGLRVDADELEDFDLDIIEAPTNLV